jgi:hypothetical protein
MPIVVPGEWILEQFRELAAGQNYVRAQVSGIHQYAPILEPREGGLQGLAALTPAGTQPQANARAEALRAAALAHFANVGTMTANGAHRAADAVNAATLGAIPPALGLASAITLASGLAATLAAHGDQDTVHWHEDAALVAFVLPVIPPVTLADLCDALDEILLGAMVPHWERALNTLSGQVGDGANAVVAPAFAGVFLAADPPVPFGLFGCGPIVRQALGQYRVTVPNVPPTVIPSYGGGAPFLAVTSYVSPTEFDILLTDDAGVPAEPGGTIQFVGFTPASAIPA